MTGPEPEPPQRGFEYPPLEDLPPAVEYPTNYSPGYPGLPPPVYPAPFPGQFADPYDPYRPVAPPGTNGKAIGALVASVFGVLACGCLVPSLAGIVLGFIALGETKTTGQAGRGLAVAAVVVGILTLMLGGLILLVGLIAD
ncbi:hypothetical protein BH09ACT7_BH09ACT7_22000 [soil metagenome]